jgi:hypothetical protein
MTLLLLFLTGVIQVFLVAANTRQVAAGRLVWAYNVHHVAISGPLAGFVYAQGAGIGTVLGIVCTRWWYGE